MIHLEFPPGYEAFALTEADVEAVIAASKPRLLTLEDQRTPAQIAFEVWKPIAARLGVHAESIDAHPSGDPQWIIAVPLFREFTPSR